jgi:hypothetical protein
MFLMEEKTMKKSEMYHLAQIAVITSPNIAPENKLLILAELIEKESLELFLEEQEGKA